MTLPRQLYKFEAFSAQALENLKAHAIYFGSPLGFNDPYDCATRPQVLKPTEAEAEFIRQHYLAKEALPAQAKKEFESLPTDELQNMLLRAGESAIEGTISQFLRARGATCFSERNDDLLMWAHYSGKYKGFCLEFSTEFTPFSKAKQVQYHKKIPEASILPFLVGDKPDRAIDFFCIKPQSWAYEKEWRIFHQNAGTRYHYEANSLTGIYFGPEISEEALEIICLILRGQNSSVKFWRGVRSKTEFKVEFEEFNYINHLEAKRLGLL